MKTALAEVTVALNETVFPLPLNVIVFVAEQLVNVLVPVTVYIVVTVGVVVIDAEVALVFHKYVTAPLAVNVDVAPIQITDGDATIDTVGLGFTVIANVLVLEHPDALTPVNV